jgi:hypothetical protein
MSGILLVDNDGLSGKDWDTITNDLEAEDNLAGGFGGGLYGGLLRPWNAGDTDRYLWGIRGGLG